MTLLTAITAAYFYLVPMLFDLSGIELSKAKTKNLSTQNYSVWGLDISHHNGKIEWSKIIISKPHFIFLKATEGITIADREFDTNWVYLKKHAIVRGAYHFFSYKSTGALQAKYYISNVTLSKGDLPPVLDVEFARKMPAPKKVTREILNWIGIIEKHYKVKPIIYCSWRYYNKYLKNKLTGDYPLWICDYRAVPDSKTKWQFWQHTDSFKIPGINYSFDRNVYRYDSITFKRMLIK